VENVQLQNKIKFIYFDFSGVLAEKIATLAAELSILRHYLLKPATVSTLEQLSKHYRLGICSNSRPSRLRTALRSFGLEKYFETVVLAHEVGELKPYPEIFERAIKAAGVKPSEIAFVDDHIRNLNGAYACGIRKLFYYSSHTPKNPMVETTTISSLDELLTKLS
jgi:HAD superfamily hydrolase (TIGR01509 family)